jgi:hypothetical protein
VGKPNESMVLSLAIGIAPGAAQCHWSRHQTAAPSPAAPSTAANRGAVPARLSSRFGSGWVQVCFVNICLRPSTAIGCGTKQYLPVMQSAVPRLFVCVSRKAVYERSHRSSQVFSGEQGAHVCSHLASSEHSNRAESRDTRCWRRVLERCRALQRAMSNAVSHHAMQVGPEPVIILHPVAPNH